jgi:hypothetical protein
VVATIQVGDEVDYFFPEACSAEPKNCFEGKVIRVTDNEGVYVEPTYRVEGMIGRGCCHHLDMTHAITLKKGELPNMCPKVSDYILIVGEVQGRVEQLKQMREQHLRNILHVGYENVQNDIGDNPLGGLLEPLALSK